MIETIRNHIVDLISNTEEMAICFYQQKIEEGYVKLDEVFNQLGNVMDEVAYLKKERIDLQINIGCMNEALSNALQALQDKDTVLFSDILNYELLEQFRNLVKEI